MARAELLVSGRGTSPQREGMTHTGKNRVRDVLVCASRLVSVQYLVQSSARDAHFLLGSAYLIIPRTVLMPLDT